MNVYGTNELPAPGSRKIKKGPPFASFIAVTWKVSPFVVTFTWINVVAMSLTEVHKLKHNDVDYI